MTPTGVTPPAAWEMRDERNHGWLLHPAGSAGKRQTVRVARVMYANVMLVNYINTCRVFVCVYARGVFVRLGGV